MITKESIENEMKIAAQKRAQYSYESAEYNYWDNKIANLAEQLKALPKAKSPLETNLQAERDAFNAKGFKSPRDAQAWCLGRGYTLSDLMAAAKAAK